MSPLPMDPDATVTRDGIVESVHFAHVAVCSLDGQLTTISGDPHTGIYPRSSLKPFQAATVRAALADAGHTLSGTQLAISCASHVGSNDHQIEAASVLAEAGLTEDALGCPAAWPEDPWVHRDLHAPTTLSHNCSGKHAAILWAHTAGGGSAETYLDVAAPLQQRIRADMADVLGEPLLGPGVDGCGLPAWRCSVAGLARGFARLMAGEGEHLQAVRDAMMCHPVLVGGHDVADTAMMWVDSRVVAKRGADGVMACAFVHPEHGPLGIAVKVLDGGNRASGPIAATVLHALGAALPTDVLRTPVLGGGQPHGIISAVPEIARRTTECFGLS